MADSDKNILISPSRGLTTQPSIVFTGQGNDPISLRVLDGTTGALSFEGSAGQLFSITDNLTSGSIFSVNDVSGLPSIDVNANGTISIGAFGGNIGIGTSNPTSKLHVVGNLSVSGSITSGNLSFAGTSLSGLTSIGFAADASDSASISTTIVGAATYFDFNLTDDNNQEQWRWRFTPSGSTVYNAMTLTPTANGVSNLAVAGTVTGTQLISTVATGTSPLSVSSTTLVTNLNADLLDGKNTGTSGNTIPLLDGTNTWSANQTFSTQVISTQANSAVTGGGQIYLNGANGNRIDFNQNGVAAPAFSTRSAGTKIVLYPGITASASDYALGIESSTLWSSVPTSSDRFRWYAGTTNIATLSGSGNLTLSGTTHTAGGNAIWHAGNDGAGSGLDADTLDGLNATSAATASTIVSRDASGNFSGATITATTLSGSLSNTLTLNTSGSGLSGSTTYNNSGAVTFTVTSNATANNTASTLVFRDASGNFSANRMTGSVLPRTGVTTYRDHAVGAFTDAAIYSRANTEDNWIYCDAANAQWGIYHRNIDSDLAVSGQVTLPQNSIAFIGNNVVRAYIGLLGGDIYSAANVTGNTLTSRVATGTAPLTVSSTTLVTNLNADLLDGLNSASASTASTIVARDASSNVFANEYRSSLTNSNQAYSGQHLVNAPFYNTFTQTGSQYQAFIKGVSTGAANTVAISFGSLHNPDNTHEIAIHRIKSDGTDSRAYTISGSGGTIWHSSNDGAGSGLDADLLDGLNQTTANTASTIVARDASGNFSAGTITAALSGNATTATTLQTARTINNVSFNGSANIVVPTIFDSNYSSIVNPGGAQYVTGTATVTGAIAITFPQKTEMMIHLSVEIYDYSSNGSLTVHCAGYFNNVANSWGNCSAYIEANPDRDRRFTVRFSYNSTTTRPIIYIGELATVWNYPQVFVTDVKIGLSPSSSAFASGWAIGFEATAFQATSVNLTANQNYRSTTNVANSIVLRDASGNFSAGLITSTSGVISGDGSTLYGPNTTWGQYLRVGGNGNNDATNASVVTTNGNLHLDAKSGASGVYLNFYKGTTGVAFGNGGGATPVAWMGPDGDLWKGSADNTGSAYWHAGNDGSGSGLDADLFDGVDSVTRSASLRANRNISGGGTITVDASYNVLWSTRFIVISNGNGSNFAASGYFDITCPTSGTITGVGGAANATATAAGIPLPTWGALYYILPIGSTNGSVAGNFRIASYTSALNVPHDWVLICVRNGDDGVVTFANGIVLSAGQSLTSAKQSNANTANTLVRRDGSGNFSAGTVTAALSGNATTATTLQTARNIGGTSFNGSADITPFRSSTIAVVDAGGLMSSSTTYAARSASSNPSQYLYGINWEFKNASAVGGTGNYAGLLTLAPWQGTTASTGDPNYQLSFNPTAANSTSPPRMQIRAGIDSTWGSWSTIWHSGNDGAGSGLDADLLDGISSASFYRSDIGNTASGGVFRFRSVDSVDVTNTGEINGLQIFQNVAGADALMTFHVSSDYAAHFGLSGGLNDLVFGGWSAGANEYRIWHAGNDGAGSGLDADLLDGKNIGTSGNTIPLLDGTNTWSGAQTFTSSLTSTSGVNIFYNSNGNSYNEGIRIPRGGSSYASIALACNTTSSGSVTGQFNLLVYPAATNNGSFSIRSNATDVLTITTGGDTTLSGSLSVGTITTSSTTANIFDTTATTINAFGGATTINLGYDTNTTTSNTINVSTVGINSGTKAINIGTGGTGTSTTLATIGTNSTTAESKVNLNGATKIFSNKNSATGPIATFSITTIGAGFRDGIWSSASSTPNGTSIVFAFGGGSLRNAYFESYGYDFSIGDTITLSSGIASSNITSTSMSGNGTTATLGFSSHSSRATTATSGTGTVATISFASVTYPPYPVGSTIVVAGVTPAGYNGTYTVTACTTTSVSYSNATTGAQTVAGTVSLIPFQVGSSIQVSSANPSGYNGVYTVTACTNTSVSYANTTTGAQVSSGIIWSANTTAAVITVTDVAGAGLTITNNSSDTGLPTSRIRLENTNINAATGLEVGTIAFAGRDLSSAANSDRAMIKGVYTGTTGGCSLEFWTAAASGLPILQASFGSTGDFRLYDSTSTYYAAITTSPTANRSLTIPDAAGEILVTSATQTLTNKTLTSPVIDTQITTNSVTIGLFDTTATTINAFGAATSINFGYDGTSSSSTLNISTGALTGSITKTVNIGTGGASDCTTTINIGSTVSSGNITANNNFVASRRFTRSGSYSSTSWSTTGVAISSSTATFTDTSGSGTISQRVANSFGIPTFASSNAVTVTDATNVYIEGTPGGGTNTSITNNWALWVDAGPSRLDGGLSVSTSTLPSRGPIATITISSGGSGYTDGVYNDVVITGGSGFDAAATLTVVGGVVTGVSFTRAGSRYRVSDTLSATSTVSGFGNGTGSGLVITVQSVTGADVLVANFSPVIRLDSTNSSSSLDTLIGGIYFATQDTTSGGQGDKVKITAVNEGTAAGGYLKIETSASGGSPNQAIHIRGNNSIRFYNSAASAYSLISTDATAVRTLTIPDATGAFVLDSASQTLTNKILSSPQIDTSITTASTTIGLFDTTATTVNAFGQTNTLNLGYDGTATSTTNICTGTSSAGTKTVNIATGGTGTSSTVGTFVNIGSSSSTAHSVIDLNGAIEINTNDRSSKGPISSIAITTAGSGLRDGVYNLSNTGGFPSSNVLSIGVGGGQIKNVTIIGGGFGFSRNDTFSYLHQSYSATGGSGNGTTATLTHAGQSIIATTATTGNGSTATLSFTSQISPPFPVGSRIVVSGVSPAEYNGTHTVTACTTSSVSYASTATAAMTVAGNIQIIPYVVGQTIVVSGANPAGYGGTYTVTASTPTTVSYANTTTGALLSATITTSGTNGLLTVTDVISAALYITNTSTSTATSRIRLENATTSVLSGTELGSIIFSSRDSSTSTTSGSAGTDRASIRGVGSGSTGEASIEFLTSGTYGTPTICASFGSTNDFRLYNSSSTFYSRITSAASTTNKSHVIPDLDGNFVLQSSSTSFITSANGITFPATQVQSSNANTLDDYEEGAFTPIYLGGTTAGVFSYAFQSGRYIKIGKLVYVEGSLGTNGITTTPTGTINISGLPFTCEFTTNQYGGLTITYTFGWNSLSHIGLFGIIQPNTTNARLYKVTAASTSQNVQMVGTDFSTLTASNYIYFNGWYRTS